MDSIRQFFLNRSTVRKYSAREVPDAVLAEIIEEASHAPTTGNMQLYSVVVTRSESGRKALSPAHFNQASVMGCNVVLTFCADFNRFVRWCEISDASPGFDNFQSFVTAMLDTALFAQQFCIIAEMRGLGCCYLGTTTYNAPQIAKILALPRRVVPVTTLAVGYPEGDVVQSDRLPLTGIVHYEKYHPYGDDDIRRIYAEKEGRDDSRKFIAENNKETLAQVFTDVRYSRENNEYFSKVYRDFIEEQGFAFP